MSDPKKPTMFPRDCPRDCPHFRAWDMSIDDWTCVCDLLHCQIDECDEDYRQARCPLDDASDRLSKICANHGLTPDGVEFALAQYQEIVCEITHGMLSKLSYYAKDVLRVAQERWCETCDLKTDGPSTFHVIDTKTGKEADIERIALREKWAAGLIYCDMEGWAIEQNGSLLLMDECGNWVCADRERFKVVWDD